MFFLSGFSTHFFHDSWSQISFVILCVSFLFTVLFPAVVFIFFLIVNDSCHKYCHVTLLSLFLFPAIPGLIVSLSTCVTNVRELLTVAVLHY
jgi:hypothetical protein